MNKQDEKKRNSAMTMIAQGQSIAGKVMVIGQGLMPGKTEVNPYRILDGAPVYYSGHNNFELEYDFESKKKLTKCLTVIRIVIIIIIFQNWNCFATFKIKRKKNA